MNVLAITVELKRRARTGPRRLARKRYLVLAALVALDDPGLFVLILRRHDRRRRGRRRRCDLRRRWRRRRQFLEARGLPGDEFHRSDGDFGLGGYLPVAFPIGDLYSQSL
jgi:hypothetical protein